MTASCSAALRRSLPLASALLLSAALLAGCGGAEDPAQTPSSASAPAASEPAASDAGGASGAGGASDDGGAETAEFAYEGEQGRTALELLLEKDPSAQVQGEGENAFVTGIEGRVADEGAKEFWALYVDGELAQVGAGSLITEDGQQIVWKLETFS